jgi:hypothetical protein
MTVQNVISNVLSNKNPEYCKDWAVTEVKALGDGRWDKVCLSQLFYCSATSEIPHVAG